MEAAGTSKYGVLVIVLPFQVNFQGNCIILRLVEIRLRIFFSFISW